MGPLPTAAATRRPTTAASRRPAAAAAGRGRRGTSEGEEGRADGQGDGEAGGPRHAGEAREGGQGTTQEEDDAATLTDGAEIRGGGIELYRMDERTVWGARRAWRATAGGEGEAFFFLQGRWMYYIDWN